MDVVHKLARSISEYFESISNTRLNNTEVESIVVTFMSAIAHFLSGIDIDEDERSRLFKEALKKVNELAHAELLKKYN